MYNLHIKPNFLLASNNSNMHTQEWYSGSQVGQFNPLFLYIDNALKSYL